MTRRRRARAHSPLTRPLGHGPGADVSSTMRLRMRFCSPVSALVAVMSVFSEMLVRWPLYLSQGPAALMLSVVHLPAT